MSRTECLAEVKKNYHGLTEQEFSELKDRVEVMLTQDPEGIQTSLKDSADAAEQMKAVVKRNHHLNFVAKNKIRSYLKEHWADHPEEGIRTLLTGVQADRPGAKDAVAVLQASLADTYIGTMLSELNMPASDGRKPMDHVKPKFWGGKNANEPQVMEIMAVMNTKGSDKSAYAGKPSSMVKAAEILLKIQEVSRKDGNESGSFHISKLDGRIVRRTHDMYKMTDVGYDTWKADMEEWGVLEASGIEADKWDDISRRHFNQTVSGERVMNPNPEVTGIPAGMANVSKSLSHERVFHFKDAASEILYFEKYGRGGLLENIVFGLEVSAQQIGLMRKLGPNARANLEQVAQEIGYTMSKGDDPKKYKRFQERSADIFKRHFAMVDGSLFVPGSNTMAKNFQWYRSIKMMALLGKAAISAIADIPLYGLEVKYHGGSFFGGMFEAVGTLFRTNTADSKNVLAGMGVLADAMRNSTMNRFDPDNMSQGLHTKLTEKFFMMSLLTPMTDKLRTGFALTRGLELAGHSKKSFKGLPDEWQRILSQFNIDEAKWDVIRTGQLKGADGRNYLTPEGVREMDDAAIIKYLEGQDQPVNTTSINFARNEIADNFRSYFHSRAHTASLEPDAGTRANMIGDTQAGTWLGEIVRSFMLFKSFPVAVMRQVAGRELRGHTSEVRTGMSGAKSMLSDSTAMGNMARLVASTTVYGALVVLLKDVASGREPNFPDEENWPKFLIRSMLQGGALGIYGDFLTGEAKNRYGGNAISTLMGPFGGDMNTVADITSNIVSPDGDAQKAGAAALKALYTNALPGSQLPYFKIPLDYLILYNLQEFADPGSLREMEDRKEKQMGQKYLMPPSSVVPHGGGMPNF